MTNLLPCPFCGGEATSWKDQHGNYGVACNTIRCFEVSDRFESSELAAEWWNRRAPAMPDDVRETIVLLLRFAKYGHAEDNNIVARIKKALAYLGDEGGRP